LRLTNLNALAASQGRKKSSSAGELTAVVLRVTVWRRNRDHLWRAELEKGFDGGVVESESTSWKKKSKLAEKKEKTQISVAAPALVQWPVLLFCHRVLLLTELTVRSETH
jgi:hypothetical protein